MKFIKTSEISSKIMTLIDESENRMILISPYCKISKWYKLQKKINEAVDRGVNIEFYIRESWENKDSFNEVAQIGLTPVEVKNLHAKLYINEKQAIVTSMNLLTSSDINSIELAYITETKKEHDELWEFFNRYILKSLPPGENKSESHEILESGWSDPMWLEKNKEEPASNFDDLDFGDLSASKSSDYSILHSFKSELLISLHKHFLDSNFQLHRGLLEANNFPLPGIRFLDNYGFACFHFEGQYDRLKAKRNSHLDEFYSELKGYRFYWPYPYNRMMLYTNNKLEFDKSDTNALLKYKLNGIIKTVTLIKELFRTN